MKILVLANFGLGLYKFRKELLEKLVKNGDEVFVSFPKDDYAQKVRDLGCQFIETDYDRKGKNPFDDLKLMTEYRRLLKEIKPGVVLTYTIKPTVYGGMACQLEKTPYIVNITGPSVAAEKGGLISKIVFMLYKLGLRKASKVFFQNKTNQDIMVNMGLIHCPYEIIPGSGVNLEQYEVYDYPKDDKVEFAFIGRITETKGIRYYLEAAKMIKEKYPQTVMHVCGGFDEDDYKQMVFDYDKEGIVAYHGLVDNMKEFYQKIHCTVLPTFYAEGMSNVLLESLASGRPIITTDRPGCGEIVDDGINGFVVKQQDAEDLYEKMRKFILLDYETKKQMGLNGRKKVEMGFDRNIVVRKYLEEIDRFRNI